MYRGTFSGAVALAISLAGGVVGVTQAESHPLELGLVQHAPVLVKHLRARGYKNVGVLKFLIAREGKPLGDNVGTLNMLMARRLEVALLLANDSRSPVGIIRNASAVAARTKGANHRSAAGRRRLFEPDYPLACGAQQAKA